MDSHFFLTLCWRKKMISPECDFNLFLERLDTKDFFTVMHMTEIEATKAERMLYLPNATDPERKACSRQYAGILKDFILYLRYGCRTRRVNDDTYRLFCCSKEEMAEHRNQCFIF